MTNYWKKLGTQTLFSHPRLTVVEDDVVLPQGKSTKYMRYEGLPDYVTVIAEKDDKIAMIKEYSYPHNEWLWQFPEGSIEASEDAQASAIRELQEEAGLAAADLRQIGCNYSHHRRSTEKNYIFLATGTQEVAKTSGDDEEYGTEVHWIPYEEIKNMISEGMIVQKNALAALALYLIRER